MNETQILNGVDLGVVQATTKAIEGDPALGACKFRTHNRWIRGGLNRATLEAAA